MKPKTPAPLTHEQRVALINKPLPTFNRYGGKSWRGSFFMDEESQQRLAGSAYNWADALNQQQED